MRIFLCLVLMLVATSASGESSLRNKFLNLSAELQSLKSGLRSIDEDLKQTRIALDDTKLRLKTIESESAELDLKLQAQELELTERIAELEARKLELKERLAQLAELKKSSVKLKTEFSDYRTTVEKEIAALKEAVIVLGVGASVLFVVEVLTIIIAVVK